MTRLEKITAIVEYEFASGEYGSFFRESRKTELTELDSDDLNEIFYDVFNSETLSQSQIEKRISRRWEERN